MTREEMKRVAKIYEKTVKFECGKTGIDEIACYEENGKYYIRICKCSCHIIATRGREKAYEVWNNSFTKEFTDVNYANNYFKKISDGFKRIK